MRPPVSRLRLGLALLLVATFGTRAAGAPTAWGCVTAGANAAGHAGHHEHGRHAPGSPAPTCICIVAGSGIGLAVEPPRLLGAVPALPSVFQPRISDAAPPLAADRHLLPFSIGPPALFG